MFVSTFTLNAQVDYNEKSAFQLTVDNYRSIQSKLATVYEQKTQLTKPQLMEVAKSVTSIGDAGKQLKSAGNLMGWGGVATALGQVLAVYGEPVSGLLLSTGGIIMTYIGYSKIEKAGVALVNASNKEN